MNLYLDDDSAAPLLVRLLQQAGHNVLVPADVPNMSGEDDPVHLTCSIRLSRVFLSHNHKDFEKLHALLHAARGHHPGIITIRKDNDPTRDLTVRGIVRALSRHIAANAPVENELIVLNHWR